MVKCVESSAVWKSGTLGTLGDGMGSFEGSLTPEATACMAFAQTWPRLAQAARLHFAIRVPHHVAIVVVLAVLARRDARQAMSCECIADVFVVENPLYHGTLLFVCNMALAVG